MNPEFQNILNKIDHRPYPMPKSLWTVTQTWENLMFIHWEVDVTELRSLVPLPLELDLFADKAYVGVVPFDMNHIKPRFLPPIPTAHHFPEINVRTYVTYKNKPGVYFFSLDGMSRIAVKIARVLYGLSYYYAKISIQSHDQKTFYHSVRQDSRGRSAEFEANYKPISEPYIASPNSLENWLTERYCLYRVNNTGDVYCGDIHHVPWSLQRANVSIKSNSMVSSIGLTTGEPDGLVLYSKYIRAFLWPLNKLK